MPVKRNTPYSSSKLHRHRRENKKKKSKMIMSLGLPLLNIYKVQDYLGYMPEIKKKKNLLLRYLSFFLIKVTCTPIKQSR